MQCSQAAPQAKGREPCCCGLLQLHLTATRTRLNAGVCTQAAPKGKGKKATEEKAEDAEDEAPAKKETKPKVRCLLGCLKQQLLAACEVQLACRDRFRCLSAGH